MPKQLREVVQFTHMLTKDECSQYFNFDISIDQRVDSFL